LGGTQSKRGDFRKNATPGKTREREQSFFQEGKALRKGEKKNRSSSQGEGNFQTAEKKGPSREKIGEREGRSPRAGGSGVGGGRATFLTPEREDCHFQKRHAKGSIR